MKIAFVYDRANKIGGAERVLVALHELYPDAPLFTLVHDPQRAPWSNGWQVITSFMQHMPFAKKYHELYPIIPVFAFEMFDFADFDVVISVTATEAKGIITRPKTMHVSYILTPTRFLWSHFDEYFRSPIFKFIASPLIAGLRMWDMIAAGRPDVLITISKSVNERIKKYYKREAEVIYPPVDTAMFKAQKVNHLRKSVNLRKNYFLIVSRLVRYKRIDLAIEACNKLNLQLKIVGDGLDKGRLERLAGLTIEFLGNLTDDDLCAYYQNCRALLFPQEEDFGIAALEALACGKPVIAFKRGGVQEIILEGRNGEFFEPQTAKALITKLEKFAEDKYSATFCRQSIEPYSKKNFKKKWSQMINTLWLKYKESYI
ncbi:MAG: glycosyltransferase [Patescibacteria group bacterium]